MIAIGLFPLTLAACLALAWAILAAGAPPVLALLAPLPAAIVCLLAEHWIPHDPAWRPQRRDVITDAMHTALSQIGGSLLAGLAVQGLAVALAPLALDSWPTRLPLAAQVALALLVGELAQYTWHRGCHALRPLWRLHATHHSTHRLYWLASARLHPLEVVIVQLASFAPITLAGAPADVLALASVMGTVVGLLQHANVELRLGPLDWIFAGPRLHRWHHAIDPAHQRSNYGGVLIVWDIVFGTRHAPAERPRVLGLDTPFPTTYVGQLLAPLRWNATATIAPSSAETATAPPRGLA